MSINIDGANAQMSIKVGEVLYSNGASVNARGGRQGDLIVSQLHGRYTEQVRSGRVFVAANQAAVATTAALATTWTGLGVANPSTSGVDMAMLQFGFAQTVAGSADGAIGLMTSDTTGFAAAITPRNRLRGGASSAALVDDGATIATPVLEQVFGSIGTVAVTAYGTELTGIIELGGSLILTPGTSVLTYTTKATTASLIFWFMWEEIPR